MKLNDEVESKIKEKAMIYLEKARDSDISHTERVVGYGRQLLQEEGGDETIIIPELYLHDTGYSKVSFGEKGTENYMLHMRYGSEIAKDILSEINYDREKTMKIVNIISIHDIPEKVFELNDLDATLALEADYLDRYGIPGAERVFDLFGKFSNENREYLEKGLNMWFRTETAKKLAQELFDEMMQYLERGKESEEVFVK